MQKNVLEYLEQTAARFPEKPALVDGTSTVTFSQLLQRSRAIGTTILRQIGAGNRPIAVMTDRSADAIIAYMGVLQSGNFYVPVDTAMPCQRMENLLTQVRPAALIFMEANQSAAQRVADCCPQILLSDAQTATPDDSLLSEARRHILDVDPVYVLFTSGSTGAPKGIVISHRNVIDFADWFTAEVGIRSDDRLGNQASFYFDLSMKDLYSCLCCGATLHILPKKCFSFPILLVRELNERKITVLNWAVSAFHLVANSGVFAKAVPEHLRLVTLGGEALQAKQLNIWRRAMPQVHYVNVYGPTEVTVDCTSYHIEKEFADTDSIPIGKAYSNMDILLLDSDGKPVPQGQMGEICVRGSGLALGYYGDWAKTEAAFVQNPLNPYYSDRLYRTGDLAIEDTDGNLLFVERKDHQIKHMGYRVELGEVETALNSLSGIHAAVCLFDQERDKIVCIYQGSMSDQEITLALKDRIPKYMLPNLYRQMEQLPYNANGKIDRVKLKNDYHGTN